MELAKKNLHQLAFDLHEGEYQSRPQGFFAFLIYWTNKNMTVKNSSNKNKNSTVKRKEP